MNKEVQWNNEKIKMSILMVRPSCHFPCLFPCPDVEELIFNTSSEYQTVDLSSTCLTKDFLRDFHHGWTVDGGQEDRTFHM